MSRVLPRAMWSDDGPDGKNQIVVASVARGVLLPLIVAAAIVIIGRWLWRAVAKSDRAPSEP